jgi:hypothetical protein
MMRHAWIMLAAVAASSAAFTPAIAQPQGNFDEAAVPAYRLPDLLAMQDGTPVRSANDWETRRRPELLRLFADNIFGHAPPAPDTIRFVVTDQAQDALDGMAIRKQVTVLLNGKEDGPQFSALLYLPAHADGPVPVFAGLNFHGNQAVADDPAIAITPSWVAAPGDGIVKHRATAASRGIEAGQWPLRQILAAGYGVATFFPADLYPDGDDRFAQSIQPFYGTNPSYPAHWGAIATWAWGLGRLADYLVTDPLVDPSRIIAIGHSRYGKAALWAAATDRRFAMVVSNNSGNGGAALYRRRFGETIGVMNDYWFAPRFKTYAAREDELPVDAHALIALMAPRPAYIASASEDLWADPKGEFLAARAAGAAYRLYGMEGLGDAPMPSAGKRIGKRVGYHLRSGPHDITAGDWDAYIAFADRELAARQD